ncbi:MAG: hypothetical protein IJH65_07315 [Methanobrevibacter sp.]|nr:hypothetical protein [Methanobrevibacter sp.]
MVKKGSKSAKEGKSIKEKKDAKGSKSAKSTTSRKKGSEKSKKGALECNSGKNYFGMNDRVTAEVKKIGDEKRLDRVVVKWMVDKKRI